MEHGKCVLLCVLLLSLTVLHVPASGLTGDIELISPGHESWTNKTNTDVPFTFRFIDPDNATADCTLNLNGVPYGPYAAGNDTNEDMYADDDFGEGVNVWNVSCVNGSTITSETRVLFADREAPSVELIFPDDGSNTSSGIVEFWFNYTDSYSGQADCYLETNDTEGDSGIFQNCTDSSFSVQLDDGSYEWWVYCTDSAGNTAGSGTRVLDVTVQFSIAISLPKNQTYEQLDDIDIRFSVNAPADWVGYSLDGSANVTLTGNTTFSVPGEGQHTMEVYANDSYGNTAYDSVHFTVSVPENPPSGGNDVDFVSPSVYIISKNFLTVNVSTDDPVEGCMLSVDGKDNVSMTEVSNTSWYYSITGLSEGGHDLEVWCNDSGTLITEDESFRVVVSGFNIDIETPLSKTYWATDAFEIMIHLGMDADSCMFYLNSQGPAMLQKYTSRMWHYNMSGVDEGTYTLLVRCNDTSGFYNSTSVSFTLKSDGCLDNETGACTGVQQCVNSECVDITCEGCAYAEGHACRPHECCIDEDCLDAQECVSNRCVGLQCDCGVIRNHACIEYECCSNFDCEINEECDPAMHNCTKRALTILAPDSITAGQEFIITLVDHDMNPVPGAKIKVEYKSGVTESLTTDDEGSVSLVAKESGPIFIMADLAGYDRVRITAEVIPGIDMAAVIIFIILLAGGGTVFFYWKQMPPLRLKKVVKGQDVLLKVKNRSGEYIEGVVISDSVPNGAFISCGLMPRVEDFGSETNLTWFASLNEGEEIVINYQAVQTLDKFLVRMGDDEYESGMDFMDFMNIIRALIGKIRPGKNTTPPLS